MASFPFIWIGSSAFLQSSTHITQQSKDYEIALTTQEKTSKKKYGVNLYNAGNTSAGTHF
jgi:hypothetical protein